MDFINNDATVSPPSEEQVIRVLDLFSRISDPFQRGKVLGKLEAYVEQDEQRKHQNIA